MLIDLRLRDYKSYRGDVHVPLRPLTVLLGKNNSGKTAVARLPLLLFAALGQREGIRRDPVPRSVRGLQYGSSMSELVHGESRHSSFGVGCTMRLPEFDVPLTVAVDIQLRQALATGHTSFVTNFVADPLLRPVAWDKNLNHADVGYSDPTLLGFDGILPSFKDDDREQRQAQTVTPSKRRPTRRAGSPHLSRQPLRVLYENRSRDDAWDPEGADAPYLLNESDELLSLVAQWYRNSLDTRIGLVQETTAFRLISPSSAGGEHGLARAGQGIQQVLPVVTHLRSMALGFGPKLMVVEEPELNLHPAAHGALSDLIVAATQSGDERQILVETHLRTWCSDCATTSRKVISAQMT